jgi:hypothetical protein
MSVYLPAAAWDMSDTRARCSGSARAVSASCSTRSRRMRPMLTQVAHQRQSHPVTPLASPGATGHQLGRDHFTETEGRSVRLAGDRLTSQVLVQARPGSAGSHRKLTNPGTVAQPYRAPICSRPITGSIVAGSGPRWAAIPYRHHGIELLDGTLCENSPPGVRVTSHADFAAAAPPESPTPTPPRPNAPWPCSGHCPG